jgi:hypothetical protein
MAVITTVVARMAHQRCSRAANEDTITRTGIATTRPAVSSSTPESTIAAVMAMADRHSNRTAACCDARMERTVTPRPTSVRASPSASGK